MEHMFTSIAQHLGCLLELLCCDFKSHTGSVPRILRASLHMYLYHSLHVWGLAINLSSRQGT